MGESERAEDDFMGVTVMTVEFKLTQEQKEMKKMKGREKWSHHRIRRFGGLWSQRTEMCGRKGAGGPRVG